jgi:hypothetical protein
MPATVRKTVILDYDQSLPKAVIQYKTLKPNSRRDYFIRQTQATDDHLPQISALVADILTNFSTLPTEKPVGGDDIYGM